MSVTRREGPPPKDVWIGVALTVVPVLGLVVATLVLFLPGAPSGLVPTASATTVPSAGGGLLNCVSVPSRCGYPDASNTGVPAGVSLRKVPQEVTSGTGWKWDSRGWLQVTANGAVVENLLVDGTIEVTGSNVTIRNNRILASGETWGVGLRHTVNATVSNNEIGVAGTPRLSVGIKDIYGDATGTKVIGNDISHTSTGVQTSEGLIEGNYIHDLAMVTGDHVNGTTSNGRTDPLTIRGNTVLNKFGQTDAISLFQDFGVEANRLVTGNLVAGGGYTIYGGMGSKGKTSNIKITNNRFSNIYFPNGGSYGPYTAHDRSGSGNVWSGNTWDHNGQPVE